MERVRDGELRCSLCNREEKDFKTVLRESRRLSDSVDPELVRHLRGRPELPPRRR